MFFTYETEADFFQHLNNTYKRVKPPGNPVSVEDGIEYKQAFVWNPQFGRKEFAVIDYTRDVSTDKVERIRDFQEQEWKTAVFKFLNDNPGITRIKPRTAKWLDGQSDDLNTWALVMVHISAAAGLNTTQAVYLITEKPTGLEASEVSNPLYILKNGF